MLWKLFLGIVASFFIVVPIVHAEEFFAKYLKYGSKGEVVIELQEFLTDEELYTGPISGSFYSLTRTAVRKFQKREKLKNTGIWDKKTRERANAIMAVRTEQVEEVEEIFTTNLQYGAKGDVVIEMQEFLADEEVYEGPISGNFYAMTRLAIRAFQKREKLQQTGVWDKKTRERANEITISSRTSEEDLNKERAQSSRPTSNGELKQPAFELSWPFITPVTPEVTPPATKQPAEQPSRIPVFLKPLVQPSVDLFTPTPSAPSTSSTTPVVTTPTSCPPTRGNNFTSGSSVCTASSCPVGCIINSAGCPIGCVDGTPCNRNGKCEYGENGLACPTDCSKSTSSEPPVVPPCGNGVCDAPGETGQNCPADCGQTGACASTRLNGFTNSTNCSTSECPGGCVFNNLGCPLGCASSQTVSTTPVITLPPTVPGDTTPPVITSTSPPPRGQLPTISWTTNESTTGEVRFEGQIFTRTTPFATSHSVEFGSFAAGAHWFTIKATDANGNSSTLDVRVDILCGDNKCFWNENATDCPNDCGSGCGDGICAATEGGNCSTDCRFCGGGRGYCSPDQVCAPIGAPHLCCKIGEYFCSNGCSATACTASSTVSVSFLRRLAGVLYQVITFPARSLGF